MAENSEFIARGLVRSWSDKLRARQGTNNAGRATSSRATVEDAFCEEVEKEDAMMSMLQEAMTGPQISPASQKLKERYAELEAAMKEFKEKFSDIDSIGKPNKSVSWNTLLETIGNLKKQHDEKSSRNFMQRSKKGFNRMCSAINDHSNVLKILPKEEKYTAIITGSVETIIKASVNYTHIGEDFAIALEEIDNIVVDAREKLKLYSDPYLQELGVHLCCKVLAFIEFPLRWYSQQSWKRAKASLNENTSLEYRKHVNAIREISNTIQRGAQLSTAREVRNISQVVTSMPNRLIERFQFHMEVQELYQREKLQRDDEKWETWERWRQEQMEELRNHRRYLDDMSKNFGAMFNLPLGPPMKQILDREAMLFVSSREVPQPRDEETEVVPTPMRSEPSDHAVNVVPDPRPQTKSLIESASEHLDRYFSYNHILVTGPEYDSFTEVEVIQRLQAWTTQARSSIIALFGPASLSTHSSSQLIASNYIRAARAAGIPCLSYFCNIPSEQVPQGRLRETVGLVSLVYALIKQSILHVPTRWVSNQGTSFDTAFAQLDGTLRTWQIALQLLKELLALNQVPMLLIVIHGLEILEHEATTEYLQGLLALFREMTRREALQTEQQQVVKVVFTTAGVSRVLSMSLSVEEILDNNRGQAAHSPGKAGKGRQRFGLMSFTNP